MTSLTDLPTPDVALEESQSAVSWDAVPGRRRRLDRPDVRAALPGRGLWPQDRPALADGPGRARLLAPDRRRDLHRHPGRGQHAGRLSGRPAAHQVAARPRRGSTSATQPMACPAWAASVVGLLILGVLLTPAAAHPRRRCRRTGGPALRGADRRGCRCSWAWALWPAPSPPAWPRRSAGCAATRCTGCIARQGGLLA
ncbi:hypothetical protein ACRAWD_19700 [Caulobacter segnis]